MPLQSVHSKAIRLNGYTDGMIVPTGAYRESGVDLFNAAHTEKTGGTNKVSSYESDDPKIGRRHFPNEGNGLNNIIGPFTLEAFVIPDRGGVILHKPDCFTLKVGEPFAAAPAVFEVHTKDPTGDAASERVSSEITYPITNTDWDTYDNGDAKPHDLDLPTRELLYLNAQFTGKRMRLYVNSDLVADMDFGGENRIIQLSSSDLFIGGQGGEFRGIIESVRVCRGIIEPKLRPFTVLPDTVGLWNFEDEDDIPQIYFFNNRNPAHPQQGKDGVGRENDGLMPLPMVCVGHGFTNISNPSGVSPASNHPVTLAAGYDYGYFQIQDFPDSIVAGLTERPTALELLASHILSVPVEELSFQSWWGSGILDIAAEVTKANYHSDGIPVSNLNAIINAGGTDPITGGSVSPLGYYDSSPEGGIDLDPMVNPIERMRIIAIDFNGQAFGPPIASRPPCVVVQSTLLQGNANPNTQGFLFDHADNTPVWFTLGNGDLVIDPGQGATRPTGQMTRARFTHNQRFSDSTGKGNDAYFIATKSRFTEDMRTQVQGASGMASLYEPPMAADLVIWLDANDKTTIKLDDGANVVSNDDYVFWWRSKARANGTMNYHFYGWGDGWRWKQNCGSANNRAGLVAITLPEALIPPIGPMAWPGGNPVHGGSIITPTYPAGKQYYGGSGWVNGLNSHRVANVGTVGAIQFHKEHSSALYGGGPDMTDGEWSFYFCFTPAYTAGASLSLIHSEINEGLDIKVDNGSGLPNLNVAGIGAFGLSANDRPTEGIPCVVGFRIDHSNTNAYWTWRNQLGAGAGTGSTTAWSPTNPLEFDDGSIRQGGFELFCKMYDFGGANSLAQMAPPGFIVHEVLIYPKFLSATEHADIEQYFEDKYGV